MKRPHLKDKELSHYLSVAFDAALEARKVHLSYYKQLKNIRNKQDSSLVSEADQESEAVIRKILRSKFHDIDILGEEEGLEKKSASKNRWIIDPLDGTTNYVHGYPFFCSSIGLELNGEIVVGVVDAVLLQRTYWGVKGFGSHCNQKRLMVSGSNTLKSSLVATGFLTYGGDTLKEQIDVFKNVVENTRGIRRSGSAALELCLLAEGALDGFWEFGLKPWDIAAAAVIIMEAGGKLSDENGDAFSLEKNCVVASNGVIHEDLLKILKSPTHK